MPEAPIADLDARIMATLAYAGLFGAGLSPAELEQRLFGPGRVAPDALRSRLSALNGGSGRLTRIGSAYCLAGTPVRTGTGAAPDLAPVRAWATAAAAIPWVRFVGLTGALAKGAPDTDMDIFVVAARGRGYAAFALMKTVGRLLAAWHGLRLCLNFLVEDDALALQPRDAFTATEFVTMVPLLDDGILAPLWEANRSWVNALCGCARPPAAAPGPAGLPRMLRRMVERLLAGAPGRWLNGRALAVKRQRLARQVGELALAGPDIVLAPGYFKQHTVSHREDILGRFGRRLEELHLDPVLSSSVLS